VWVRGEWREGGVVGSLHGVCDCLVGWLFGLVGRIGVMS
jgi:hypothetical protein